MNGLLLQSVLGVGVLLAAEYHVHVGDPDAFSWVIVVTYGLACGQALWMARRLHRDRQGRAIVALWCLLAAVLLALGINKQLDLQTWITAEGRDLALSEGWFAYRRKVQILVVAGMAVFSTSAFVASLIILRRRWRESWLPFTGACLLVAYALIRASTIYHINLAGRTPGILHWLCVSLELAGNLLIAGGVLREQLWPFRPSAAETPVRA